MARTAHRDAALVWVMARKPEIKKRLVTEHQYPEGLTRPRGGARKAGPRLNGPIRLEAPRRRRLPEVNVCYDAGILEQGKGACAYSSSESSVMTRRFFAGALTSSNWNSSSSSSFGVLPVW